MMKQKGSIIASFSLFLIIVVLFLIFFGVCLFEIVITGELHEIKNDLYIINRNVLLACNHSLMGNDVKAFYENEVEELIEEEIKRQWNIDVSKDIEDGRFKRVDIIKANITNLDEKMYIKSELEITLRPIVFSTILEDRLKFIVSESVKVEKMRSW